MNDGSCSSAVVVMSVELTIDWSYSFTSFSGSPSVTPAWKLPPSRLCTQCPWYHCPHAFQFSF